MKRDIDSKEYILSLRNEVLEYATKNDITFIKALNLFICRDNRFNGIVTYNDIGILMGVSKQRVEQIEKSAVRKLSSPTISRDFKEYIDS